MNFAIRDLLPGARTCVNSFAKVNDDDCVLILSDNPLISDAIADAIREVSRTAVIDSIYLSPSVRPLPRVSKAMAGALGDATVVFSVICFHDDELPFRKEMLEFPAGKEGRRIYHMLGVNEATFTGQGALGLSEEEVQEMEALTSDVAIALTMASKARIQSALHSLTDLELSLGDCENIGSASTGRVQLGTWGNLPSGEAFILPISASGRIIIDKAVSGIEPGFIPFDLDVVQSRVMFDERSESPLLDKLRYYEALAEKQNTPPEDVRRVCEFGVGTNPKAKAFNFIEIEKILGTVHIALGTNTFLGGKIMAPNHIDMVINKPTVTLDDRFTIIRDGKVNKQVVRELPKLNHTEFGISGISLKQEVERFEERVRDDGHCLWRVWQDGRRNRLETSIGAKDTAQVSRDVWRAFGDHKVREVRQLSKSFAAAFGDSANNQATVLRALGVLERFGVVSLRQLPFIEERKA